jgi:hypothetical protein
VIFEPSPEERHFAESVRAAIAGRQPPLEPELGTWLDDRDDVHAMRLHEAGWSELWVDLELLGAAVAGGFELGRVCAPACLLDEPTLGGVLAIDGRARHGAGAARLAVPSPDGGLVLATSSGEPVFEPTLDGSGTVRVGVANVDRLEGREARARWRAWTAVTLAYLAGLAAEALDRSVEHVRTREQFGAPLAALPAVQGRLADAALAVAGLELLARAASKAESEEGLDRPALLWAGSSCCEVAAAAHQLHGALGFALETGLHSLSRRAVSMRVWGAAVCAATR